MMIESDKPDDQILIAGLGNILLGNDGFGIEVVRRLKTHQLSECVKIVDFGINGIDLAYSIMHGYRLVVIVDLVQLGDRPGTICVIEPELASESKIDFHRMNPESICDFVRSMNGDLSRVVIVGCEPDHISDVDVAEGLTSIVEGSVELAVQVVESIIARVEKEGPP